MFYRRLLCPSLALQCVEHSHASDDMFKMLYLQNWYTLIYNAYTDKEVCTYVRMMVFTKFLLSSALNTAHTAHWDRTNIYNKWIDCLKVTKRTTFKFKFESKTQVLHFSFNCYSRNVNTTLIHVENQSFLLEIGMFSYISL